MGWIQSELRLVVRPTALRAEAHACGKPARLAPRGDLQVT